MGRTRASCASGAAPVPCRRRSSRPRRWTSVPLALLGGSSGTLSTTPLCTSSARSALGVLSGGFGLLGRQLPQGYLRSELPALISISFDRVVFCIRYSVAWPSSHRQVGSCIFAPRRACHSSV